MPQIILDKIVLTCLGKLDEVKKIIWKSKTYQFIFLNLKKAKLAFSEFTMKTICIYF